MPAHNSGLAKVAVQCSADPEVSGWLIKHWFSASIPIAIGMVKIATFAKPQNVSGHPANNIYSSPIYIYNEKQKSIFRH